MTSDYLCNEVFSQKNLRLVLEILRGGIGSFLRKFTIHSRLLTSWLVLLNGNQMSKWQPLNLIKWLGKKNLLHLKAQIVQYIPTVLLKNAMGIENLLLHTL